MRQRTLALGPRVNPLHWGVTEIDLPRDLQAAIDDELSSFSSRTLAAKAEGLSKRYRGAWPAGGNDTKFLQSQGDIAAYIAFRLPATFAAVFAALSQVRDGRPGWTPETVADIGAGPGTAMWAASTIWLAIRSITLLEREDGMIALGKRIALYSSAAPVRNAEWLKADISGAWDMEPHDLVVAGYVLGELPDDRAAALIRKLWSVTSEEGTLAIVEPGTPAGFGRIKQVRDQVLSEGAHVVAPCPHDKPCPMGDNDWCHFAQRVSRSRIHKQVKAGDLPYEDEKFSFIAVSRVQGATIPGRVIRHPQVRPGHIHFEACTTEGLATTVVTRRDRERFRRARDARWGSILP